MFRIITLFFLFLATNNTFSKPTPSQTLNQIAKNGLDEQFLVNRNDSTFLYGIQTNGTDTHNGQWACAKVASILLQKSGLLPHPVLAVAQIEKELSLWKRIDREKDLKPGDVVIWTRRYNAPSNGKCIGSGTCHVGIYTDSGYVHNSPIARKPTLGGLSLLAFKFKAAYRPPN